MEWTPRPLQIAPQTGGGGELVVHAEQTVVGGGEQNFALLARTHPSHVHLCHPTLVVKSPLHQDDGQVTFLVRHGDGHQVTGHHGLISLPRQVLHIEAQAAPFLQLVIDVVEKGLKGALQQADAGGADHHGAVLLRQI